MISKAKNTINLSDHFTMGRLMRFTLPSIAMMVLSSVYTIVDGLFVANFVSGNALAAINIVMPIFIVVSAVGFMFGTGGSAEVAKVMGEGRDEDAKSYFTTLVAVVAAAGIILSILSICFMRPICYMSGASDLLIDDCTIYGMIIMAGNVPYMLQTFFQAFFVTAEKPKLGMILTIASGITNAFLDYLLIVVLQWDIAGAATATSIGCMVGGFLPLIYFAQKNSSRLHFVKLRFHGHMLARSAANGSSEMVGNLSRAIVTLLFNIQLMHMAGENGVAAISIMEYLNFIFISALIGFSVGVAPVIAFHFGAENHKELKGLFRYCIIFIVVSSIVLFALSELFAPDLVLIFIRDNPALYDMTLYGLRLFAFSFLTVGINIFTSALFTAFSNGKISALISACRTLIFEVAAILLLPLALDLDGIWLSLPVAEGLALIISLICMIAYRKRYHYI